MKLPLALTVIILAAGSFWGAREQSALTVLRERHRRIAEEAAALGVSTDPSKTFSPSKASKRAREDSTRKVKDFAEKLVAYAREGEEMEKSGVTPDDESRERMMKLIEGVLSLNGDELKILIAELRGRTDISDEMRGNMIGFSIIMLAEQNPRAALALFTESSDLLEDDSMSRHAISSALTQWANDQPLEAAAWIKKNSGKHKDLVTEEAKRAVIAGAAKNNFSLAFQLADEIKFDENKGRMVSSMLRSAESPERQTEFLTAIRKQAAAMTDKAEAEKLLKLGTEQLFSKVSGSGFDKSMEWLKTANLSADEIVNLTGNLNYGQTKADTGKWLDWMSLQVPNGKETSITTRDLVRQWTQQDYKAAGEWLAKSPAGPLKDSATLSYLETVAPYDPDVAAQWAATLPAGKQGDALKTIHKALGKKDKAAAEEFARRHGIGEP